VALDGARARRRPQNRQRSMAGDGGAPCMRGQSERVGQRAQMREERCASRAQGSKGARGRGRGRSRRGGGRDHDGEIVGERLGTTDRWGRRERERGIGRARETAPTARPHRAARERGSEHARFGADRRDPTVRHTGHASARGLGLLGWLGPKWPFPFSWNFYCLLYLFSLGFSIQIQIKFKIQTKSNMCNNSKNI
jgi:hypothetical protein